MRISDWSSDVCSSDLFNPTDPEGRTARYNPLGYIDRTDPDQVVIELQKIATMLFVPPERGEPFWTDSARTAFVGVGAYLAVADQPFTIGAIYRLMTTGDTRGFFRRVLDDRSPRSEERRGGKEWVSTCRSRWSPSH